METENEKRTKQGGRFSQSITLKAIIIAILTLVMLIPGIMIQELIRERQERSIDTVEKIYDKWSKAQTLSGPVLAVPYLEPLRDDEKKTTTYKAQEFFIAPEELSIETKLLPEERHYGIYKAIVYKSEITVSGYFDGIDLKTAGLESVDWNRMYVNMQFSDLRGITNKLAIDINGEQYAARVGDENSLSFALNGKETVDADGRLSFSCRLNLNGSSYIGFVPIGRTTKVHVTGSWDSPSFFGEFMPTLTEKETGFDASWSVLSYNRGIPDCWKDHAPYYNSDFGVQLINPVDHYQQNMRSAKYASLFIILTFVVFFFVELLTRKRIHPIQYILVGAALLLFYTLLLSISEQLSFFLSYLIASLMTVGLITGYSHTIFRSPRQTGILAFTLSGLYVFLYTVLQLEDIALLIGSIGLFVILSIVMFVSRKVNWYKHEE